jgi:hypothetical protein
MKKKYLFFVALVLILGSAVSGCYVDRGYYHPYYHPHHHHYYHNY